MTLTLTLELSPAQEKQLRMGVANHDAESVRQLLLDALEPTVANLLSRPPEKQKKLEQRHALAKQLRALIAESLPTNYTGLPDYAVSREGIYGDHP